MNKKILLYALIAILSLQIASALGYNYTWLSNNPDDYYAFFNGTSEVAAKGTWSSPSGAPVFDSTTIGVWCSLSNGDDFILQANGTIPPGNRSVIIDVFNATPTATYFNLKSITQTGGSDATTFRPYDNTYGGLEYLDTDGTEVNWSEVGNIWRQGSTGINLTIISHHDTIANLVQLKAYYRENGTLINGTDWFTQRNDPNDYADQEFGSNVGGLAVCFGNVRTALGYIEPNVSAPPADTLTVSFVNVDGDTVSPYHTSNRTPPVNITTDKNALCRISNDTTLDYTTMGAGRQCTVGESTGDHLCYLTSGDQLALNVSNSIQIACLNGTTEGNLTINNVIADQDAPTITLDYPTNGTWYKTGTNLLQFLQ